MVTGENLWGLGAGRNRSFRGAGRSYSIASDKSTEPAAQGRVLGRRQRDWGKTEEGDCFCFCSLCHLFMCLFMHSFTHAALTPLEGTIRSGKSSQRCPDSAV